jgi:apolipoprotein N-acyltransferase
MRALLRGLHFNPQADFLQVAILLIAACAHAVSLGWPFEVYSWLGKTSWWLQSASMAVMVALIYQQSPNYLAGLNAWVFCSVWLAATFWWLYVAMNTYGGLPGPLSLIGLVALAIALAAYYAGAIWLWRTRIRRGAIVASFSFGALWCMAEMARGTWFTGFGWGAVGYAHVDGPLAYFFPILGVYGVSALAAGCAASLGIAFVEKRLGLALGALALLLAPALAPMGWNDWTAPTSTLHVSLLQGNIPQNEKFESGTGVPIALEWYRHALMQSEGDLVVAPETAIPVLPQELPLGYWGAVLDRFSHGQQASLIGIPLGDLEKGYSNSVVGITPAHGLALRYDKHHLVPFGEFIPPFFRWFTDLMYIPLGDFHRGPLGQPSLDVLGERVAPNICYEDLYGEELATRFVDSDKAPTLFANVSNMGWFGDTVALQQHLNISRVRALEFQRPFVRATNTGATAILSHEGHVLAQLPPHTRGVLRGEVQGREGITPFAWWASRFGLWPLWLGCLAIVAWAWRRQP